MGGEKVGQNRQEDGRSSTSRQGKGRSRKGGKKGQRRRRIFVRAAPEASLALTQAEEEWKIRSAHIKKRRVPRSMSPASHGGVGK